MSDNGSCEERPTPYVVEYVSEVEEFILKNVWSERVYSKIVSYVDLLSEFPDMGTPYNPEYPAAVPPFPCRFIAVPDTPFTLYYIKLAELKKVVIIYIENQSADPNSRFNWQTLSF